MQRLVNNFLGNIRPIGIRGIDKINPKLRQALQHLHGFGAIIRLAPNAFPGNTHRPEPEAMDLDIYRRL